ncbi:MAG: outer membrane receptor for ferrienterochelin and colicins, partial [Paracoccaceae bacterium]
MARRLSSKFFNFGLLSMAITLCSQGLAQDQTSLDDSTIVYNAEFFFQFSPVSVNDMIDRIPGIGLALGGGNS